MAKRLSDTDKWKKPFLRCMEAPYKLLWLYILDECDHAGIWQVDFEVAQLKIGEQLNIETALRFFDGRVKVLDDKWFIPDFIDFQYGDLNPVNRVHNSVMTILKRYNLLDENNKIKPLTSPLQGAKDKDKDMDKDKEQDKDFGKSENLLVIHEDETVKILNENAISIEVWNAFQKLLNEECPRVQKLSKPITLTDYAKYHFLYESEEGKGVLLAMQNHKKLLSNYVSANQTFLNWMEIRKNKKQDGSTSKKTTLTTTSNFLNEKNGHI